MDPLKFWTSDEFEISSFRWGLHERKNSVHFTSGSDNTNNCKYTYNELGFRGDSITKNGFKIMSLGDSCTEGVGVNDSETWTHQFSTKISNSVNMNFGTGGRSNDFITRCLLSFCDLIQPDLILIMYTPLQRREIYTENCGVEPFMPTSTWGYTKETKEGRIIQTNLCSIQNEHEDLINWYKNHNLIKFYLESKKINWIWNGWAGVPETIKEYNRFDGDFGKFIDFSAEGHHPGPSHNKKYSDKLFDYISEKFPNYLLSI
jgi:hypothetical protein